jgi:hypothetical protein
VPGIGGCGADAVFGRANSQNIAIATQRYRCSKTIPNSFAINI